METGIVSGINILGKEGGTTQSTPHGISRLLKIMQTRQALVIAGIEGNGMLLAQKLVAELKNIHSNSHTVFNHPTGQKAAAGGNPVRKQKLGWHCDYRRGRCIEHG